LLRPVLLGVADQEVDGCAGVPTAVVLEQAVWHEQCRFGAEGQAQALPGGRPHLAGAPTHSHALLRQDAGQERDRRFRRHFFLDEPVEV
jgi:hypothetical protein